MKNNSYKINVKFRGIADYIDGENAPETACEKATNLREKGDAMVAIGKPKQVSTLANGEKIVTIHRTSSAKKHLISTIGNSVILHGSIEADGSVTQSGQTLTTTGSPINAVKSIGDFLLIATIEGNILLKYNATTGTYITLDIADAIPRLFLSASGKHTISDNIPAYTLASPLQHWQGPLLAEDIDNISALTVDAYKRLLGNASAEGYMAQPILARYAVRLWNNDYLWVSAPILLGHGIQTISTAATATVNDNYYTGINAASVSIDAYRLSVAVEDGTSEQWDGIIKSIDILISDEIDPILTTSPVEWSFSRPTVDGVTINRLSFGLQASDSNTFIANLLATEQWRVACSIYDLAALRQGNVNASNCQLSIDSSGLPTEMMRYEITNVTTRTAEATDLDRCASASARRHCHTTFCVHNRRMFAAGGNALLTNPWHPSQWWHGTLTAATCRVVAETHIKTPSGEAITVWQGMTDTVPEAMNPIIAYPDARATSMKISLLPNGGKVKRVEVSLHSVPGHDMACSAADANLQPLQFTSTDSDTLPVPTPTLNTEDTTGEVVEYEELNPLTIARWHNVCDSTIRAMAATSHHTNNNIGTPLYIFADDGTYAMPYRIATAQYSPAVILSRQAIAPTVPPADSDTAVFFATTRGKVCQLERYSIATMINDMDGIEQIAWNDTENELWIKTENKLMVAMASGRTYCRNDNAYDQLCHLSPTDAYATSTGGSLLDITREQSSDAVAIELLTYPIIIADEAAMPHSVTWRIFSSNATLDMSMTGEHGASCHGMTLCRIKASGAVSAPIRVKLITPPVRTVRLAVTGSVTSSTIMRPSLIVL